MRAPLRAAARPRSAIRRRATLAGVDTSPVGIEAAKLMDDLVEQLPEGSTVAEVGLVVAVKMPGEDGEALEGVHIRSTSSRRLIQIGLFAMAAKIASSATEDDEDEDEDEDAG